MHIAIKWSMDDIQLAITKAIQIPSRKEPHAPTEILRLAFVAEFSSYFSKDFAANVFVDASSGDYQPTGNDLGLLMAHPSLVALMMEYREAHVDPDDIPWVDTHDKEWLSENLESFEFKPRA